MSNYQHRRFTLSQSMKNRSSELASRRSRHHYHSDRRPNHHLSNHDATKECRFLDCARRCVFTGSVVLVPSSSVAEDRINVTDDNDEDGKKETMGSAISSSITTGKSASIPSIRIEEGNNMDGGEDGKGDDAHEEKNGDGNADTHDENSNQSNSLKGIKKKEKQIHKKKKKKKNIIAVRTTSILPKCDNSVKVFNDECGTSNPTFATSPDSSSAAATDYSVKEICVQPLIVLDLNGILCHRVRFRDIPPSILASVLADNQQQQQQQKQQRIQKETKNCTDEDKKELKNSASSSPPPQSSSNLDHSELNKEITSSEPRTTNSKRKRSNGNQEQQSMPPSSTSRQCQSPMNIDLDATKKNVSSSCNNNHSSSNKKESYKSPLLNKRHTIDDERDNLHQITKQIYRQPMGRVSGTDIVARTDIASFLRFLNQHFCLAVWTSAKKKTANYLIDMLFPADVKRCLLFVWGQNRCNMVRNTDVEAAVLADADSTAKQSGHAVGAGAGAGGEDHLLSATNSTNGNNVSDGDGGNRAKDRHPPPITATATTEPSVDAAETNDDANLNSNVAVTTPSPTIHRKGRHREIVFIKSLSKVWEEYPLWNPSNTLLIDDSPEKCPEKFRKNVVHPPPILGLDAPNLSFLPNVEGMIPIVTATATSKVKSTAVKTESRNLSENMNDCFPVDSNESSVLKRTKIDGNHTNKSNIGIHLHLDNENVHKSNQKQKQMHCQEGEEFPPDVFIDEVNQFKQLLFFQKLANVWKKSHSEEEVSKTIDSNLARICDENDDDDHIIENMGSAEDGRLEQFLNKFGRGHMGWQCKQ